MEQREHVSLTEHGVERVLFVKVITVTIADGGDGSSYLGMAVQLYVQAHLGHYTS